MKKTKTKSRAEMRKAGYVRRDVWIRPAGDSELKKAVERINKDCDGDVVWINKFINNVN